MPDKYTTPINVGHLAPTIKIPTIDEILKTVPTPQELSSGIGTLEQPKPIAEDPFEKARKAYSNVAPLDLDKIGNKYEDKRVKFTEEDLNKVNPGDTISDRALFDSNYEAVKRAGQGDLERWGNTAKQFGSAATSTFLGGLATIPNLIGSTINGIGYLAGNENPISSYFNIGYDSGVNKDLSDFIDNTNKNNRNYKSNWSNENWMLDMLPFWGDGGWNDIVASSGYTAGAIAEALLTGGAATVLSKGTKLAGMGGRISNYLNNPETIDKALKAFSAINKEGTVGKIVGEGGYMLGKAIEASPQLYRAYVGSTVEAAFEGLEGAKRFEEDAVNEYKRKNYGMSPDEATLKKIKDVAQEAGDLRYKLNLAILTVPNYLQMGAMLKTFPGAEKTAKMLFGKNTLGELETDGLSKFKVNEAKDIQLNWKNQKLKTVGETVLKYGQQYGKVPLSFSEGGEELAQYFIDEYTSSLYKGHYYNEKTLQENGGYLGNLLKTIVDKGGTKEAAQAFLMGSIGGGIQQLTNTMYEAATNKNKLVEKIANNNMQAAKLETLSEALFGKEELGNSLTEEDKEFVKNTYAEGINQGSINGTLEDNYKRALSSLNSLAVQQEILQFGGLDAQRRYQDIKDRHISGTLHHVVATGKQDVFKEHLKSLSEATPDQIVDAYGVNIIDQARDNKQFAADMLQRLNEIESNAKKINFQFNEQFDNVKDESLYQTYKGQLSHLQYMIGRKKQRIEDITTPNTKVLNEVLEGKFKYLDDEIERLAAVASVDKTATDELNRKKKAKQLFETFYKNIERRKGKALTSDINSLAEAFNNLNGVTDGTFYSALDELRIQQDVKALSSDISDKNQQSLVSQYRALYQKDGYKEFKKQYEEYDASLQAQRKDAEKQANVKALFDKTLEDKKSVLDVKAIEKDVQEYAEAIININNNVDISEAEKDVQRQAELDKLDKAILAATPVTTTATTTVPVPIATPPVATTIAPVAPPAAPVTPIITTSAAATLSAAPKKTSKALEVKESLKFSDLVGKTVYYNSVPYVIKQEGNKFILENDVRIYEFDDALISDFNISLPIEKQNLTKEYNVVVNSELDVVVNGVSYTILNDENGNVAGLSPVSTPEQTLRNERLLVAVEIERNKQDFSSIDALVEDEQVYEMIKATNNPLITVERIYAENFSDTIGNAIDKLYDGEELNSSQKLALELWIGDVFLKLREVQDVDKNEIYQNALDNLEIINTLLYTNTKIDEQNVEEAGAVIPTETPVKKRTRKPKSEKVEKPTKVKKNVTPEAKQQSVQEILQEDSRFPFDPTPLTELIPFEGNEEEAIPDDFQEQETEGMNEPEPTVEIPVGEESSVLQAQPITVPEEAYSLFDGDGKLLPEETLVVRNTLNDSSGSNNIQVLQNEYYLTLESYNSDKRFFSEQFKLRKLILNNATNLNSIAGIRLDPNPQTFAIPDGKAHFQNLPVQQGGSENFVKLFAADIYRIIADVPEQYRTENNQDLTEVILYEFRSLSKGFAVSAAYVNKLLGITLDNKNKQLSVENTTGNGINLETGRWTGKFVNKEEYVSLYKLLNVLSDSQKQVMYAALNLFPQVVEEAMETERVFQAKQSVTFNRILNYHASARLDVLEEKAVSSYAPNFNVTIPLDEMSSNVYIDKEGNQHQVILKIDLKDLREAIANENDEENSTSENTIDYNKIIENAIDLTNPFIKNKVGGKLLLTIFKDIKNQLKQQLKTEGIQPVHFLENGYNVIYSSTDGKVYVKPLLAKDAREEVDALDIVTMINENDQKTTREIGEGFHVLLHGISAQVGVPFKITNIKFNKFNEFRSLAFMMEWMEDGQPKSKRIHVPFKNNTDISGHIETVLKEKLSKMEINKKPIDIKKINVSFVSGIKKAPIDYSEIIQNNNQVKPGLVWTRNDFKKGTMVEFFNDRVVPRISDVQIGTPEFVVPEPVKEVSTPVVEEPVKSGGVSETIVEYSSPILEKLNKFANITLTNPNNKLDKVVILKDKHYIDIIEEIEKIDHSYLINEANTKSEVSSFLEEELFNEIKNKINTLSCA